MILTPIETVLAILTDTSPSPPDVECRFNVAFQKLDHVKFVVIVGDIRLIQHGIIKTITVFINVRFLCHRANMIHGLS